MPSGRMKWFDPRTGEGVVEHGTREYPTRAHDVAPPARITGAPVRFDVVREGGVERAVGVRLREGTRASNRQRRFDDLVGAARPEEKGRPPLTHRHPDPEPLPLPPLEVARRWLLAMEGRDPEAAAVLYAPDARVHVGAETLEGRRRIRAYLPACPLFGMGTEEVEPGGEAEGARVAWRPTDDVPGGETRLRIEHGWIVEQWIVPSGTE
ncbi:MAG TPA: nuclear transport factor 2 family protein [Actinomycetota bacterium]|nr:nuclear transport factor 2 family protein [Actinomycetota bacterium]